MPKDPRSKVDKWKDTNQITILTIKWDMITTNIIMAMRMRMTNSMTMDNSIKDSRRIMTKIKITIKIMVHHNSTR